MDMQKNNKIPFSLPYIDKSVVDEVNDTICNTGWLTSGPKVIELENELKKLTEINNVICVNSWSSGAMLILRWFGVGPGDEVIIPSYTYSATAISVLNIGAKPVMVDVDDDFTISVDKLDEKINSNTKAIMPVDIAGMPCNYEGINQIINSEKNIKLFKSKSESQSKLNRILIMSDAAHSIGSIYQGKPASKMSDFTIYSFHSVKNITTGEGGAVCINLPENFDNNYEYKRLKNLSLNGQTKSAFQKNKIGGWKYDIIDQGLKINMPDICAAIGLAQIRKYKSMLLLERKKIFDYYNNFFKDYNWAILPKYIDESRESSYHLYMLRINGINENKRDEMIKYISDNGVGVNVHYIPMPMLTLFKNLEYKISDYPNTYKLYCNEITLPVYNNLSDDNLLRICKTVKSAYLKLL